MSAGTPGSTETAIVQGIGRTGRLVTSAALILFLSFTSMASRPVAAGMAGARAPRPALAPAAATRGAGAGLSGASCAGRAFRRR